MGNSSGPGAPNVAGPVYTGYTAPANWDNPAVTGHDLMVHTGTLRSVASQLGMLATQLEHALGNWQAQAGPAASGTAAGSWPAALSLGAVIGKAHRGVLQFTGELQKAHNDMQTRLTQSADNYDAAEQHVASIANRSTDPTATIIGAGGNNSAAVPTPQQARLLALEHHMDPGAGSAENWQQTLPIVEDSSFDAGSTSGYTWDSVRSQLDGTDSGAIQSAGEAYMTLYSALTDIAGKLPGQGATLAADWGGVNAVTAVSQVQQLHQTASDMQANTFAAGAALRYYGGVLDTFKSNLPASGSTPTTGAHAAAASQAAQRYMQALNGHVQSAYYNMPGAVNKNLPPPLASAGGSGTTGGVGYGVGYGGANNAATGGAGSGASGGGVPGMPAPGGTAPVPGLPAPGGTVPGGTVPGGTVPGGTVPGGTVPGGAAPGGTAPGAPPPGSITPPPTRLAGVGPGVGIAPVGPGPASAGTPPPVTPTPGGPGPGVGVLPPPPVNPIGPGGPGGSGGVRPGGPGGTDPAPAEIGVGVPGGADPVPPDVPGITPAGVITGQGGPGGLAGEDGLATSGDVAAGDAMGGPGMMPMMGGMPGGAGQGGVGRERESWASEDDGTWGPDAAAADSAGAAADGAFPGMMPFGAGRGQGQERDRNRLVWMSEEDDLWGAGQPVTPPVISQN